MIAALLLLLAQTAVPLAEPAPSGTVFKLTAEPDKDWLKWSPKIAVKSLESVSEAPPIPAILK